MPGFSWQSFGGIYFFEQEKEQLRESWFRG
jgi:hypothetical protein